MKSTFSKFTKLLAVLMAVAVCITCVPVTSMTAEAGANNRSISFHWNFYNYEGTTPTLTVEKGLKNLDIVNYAYSYRYGYLSDSNMMDATVFTSSKKAVATINGEGLLTLKKTGTTKITIKIGSQKIAANVKVINNTANFKTEQSIMKEMNKLWAKYEKAEITAANRAKFVKDIYALNTKIMNLNYKLTKVKSNTCLYGPIKTAKYDNFVAIPDSRSWSKLTGKLSSYKNSVFNCYRWVYDSGKAYGYHVDVPATKKNTKAVKLNFVDTSYKNSYDGSLSDSNGYYSEESENYVKSVHKITTDDIFALTTLEQSKSISANPSKVTLKFTLFKKCTKCGSFHDIYTTGSATIKKGVTSATVKTKKKLSAGVYELRPDGSYSSMSTTKFEVK